MTATMNTTPATIPTHAATAVSLLWRRSYTCGGGGGVVAMGPVVGGGVVAMGPVVGSVVGSVGGVGSVMSTMIVAVLRCD
jgi:hypothetical protein